MADAQDLIGGKMALLIPGKTSCLLCGKLIESHQTTEGFPPFLGASHPLSQYSDAVFHSECFAICPDRDSVRNLFRRYRDIWDNRPSQIKTAAEIEAWGKNAFKEFS